MNYDLEYHGCNFGATVIKSNSNADLKNRFEYKNKGAWSPQDWCWHCEVK